MVLYPALHAQVADPAALVLLAGHAVHDGEPGRLNVFAGHTVVIGACVNER